MSQVLVAGVGNVLMGDDGFGVSVVLCRSASRGRVRYVDFGIRAYDLAFALEVDVATIIVDAAARGRPPGTVTVLAPDEISALVDGDVEGHGMHPLKALQMARTLGTLPRVLRLVVCEPAVLGTEDEPIMGLSPAVRAAVPSALREVDRLVGELSDA